MNTKTFSKHAALHEHTKSHKDQAYWEILNNISDISNSTRVENVETKINIEDDDTVININECDREDDGKSEENNENNFEESNGRESDINETIETEEKNIENIPNFILYNPELNNTYAEFMELVSTHHLSNYAGNSVLKWFRKHYFQND
ncbi:hypothetical protein RhiirA1_476247 [Rhizophagus irregularis]|uniref:Uncharacterized protein n=1 Tax=Rhizophagus irregularis TaxID=588596 RepID=A0A2N0QVJ8_9GLOM|nr:hypothetical protein RhiirA1_476247 [Rhizophagus irregularis]